MTFRGADRFIEICKCYLVCSLQVLFTLTYWYCKKMCVPEQGRNEYYILLQHLNSPKFTKVIHDKDTDASLEQLKSIISI